MVTSGRCPILKNLSVGGWSHPRLWIVWWKKKRFSQKICVLGDGQACVRAESQIEVDAHPRSVTCTHTHTEPPDSSWVLPPPNSTSTKWNLSVTGARRPSFTPYWNKLDPRRGHAHTDSTVTPAEERLMERWRQDGKMLSSPFPRCHTGSYLTLLRVALLSAPCCDPALLIPLLFLTLRLTPPSFLRLSFFLNPRETVLHFCLSVFKLFLSQTPGSPSFFPQHAPQFHPPWLNPALSPRAPFTSDFDRPYFVAGTVKRTLWDWVEVAQTHTHWHLVVTQHCWSWDFHVLQEMSSLDSKWFVLQRIPALNFLEIAVVSHKYLHQGCI